MQIRAAVLRVMGLAKPYSASMPLKIENLTLSPPGFSEVLVRIRAAGLCHSDLSAINGSRKRPVPLAMGHEAAGEVVELGPGVSGFEIGDHVVMSFSPSCGHCGPCQEGRAALCEPGLKANTEGVLMNGERCLSDASGHEVNHHLGVSGFADHAVVSTDSLVKIDPTLDFRHAALFGCAVMTGVGAAINTAGVRPGDAVAVIGLGGVGLSAVMGAKVAGASEVIAIDTLPHKLELAKQVGATDAVLASDASQYAGRFHVVIETAGVIKALESAISLTKRGGKTVTPGLPPSGSYLPLDVSKIVGAELKLAGSYMGSCVPSRDIPRYISLFQQGRLPVDKLMSSIIDFEDINHGFDLLDQGKAVRTVITF